MRNRWGISVALVLTSLVALGVATITSATTSTTTTTMGSPTTTTLAVSNLACASKIVATWSLVRQANETVSVSVNALDIGAMGPAATAGYGGILLFGTTAPAKFSAIVATLQRETPGKYAMLVMTDQEGGGVERLTNLVATLPWAQTMGKNLSPTQITAEGRRVGASMKSVGINTDLAPVLDVDGRAVEPGSTNPDGYRSFSGVASKAASDGVAFLNGLRSAHVTSVVKHFPGLGYATGNTDYGPAATLPWTKLKTTGLIPFQAAINDGVSAVMLSNATIPGFSSLPSSISPVVIRYLRQKMGFSGLIVTDALSAGALSLIHLGVPAASAKALEAGADLVLAGSSSSPAASLHLALLTSNAIQKAVTTGALPLATLEAADAQVLASENTFLVC
ncbi:MAG TPA: glycoside hydrolase family 3 N-terminal domain-containing protein [Acidimicrobiales bacterium]